ncbi:hypothetical protein LINGRAHAP2_LOCUS1676, partial [Linum grandiflorum]
MAQRSWAELRTKQKGPIGFRPHAMYMYTACGPPTAPLVLFKGQGERKG